jgi:ATP-binding cassette subfamily G (WHITE) protein 2 (SNQ2)
MDNPGPRETHLHEHTEGPTFESINTHHNGASTRTSSVDESTARNSPKLNEKDDSNARGGVNVHRAESDFAELSKELSRTSNISHRMSRVQSRHSRKDQAATDVEKAGSEASDEPFDLEATLRGGRDEEERAGIKSKRIGVMWDGLTVSGIGTILCINFT